MTQLGSFQRLESIMFFKSKKLVGLDIGTSSIKIAEVEVTRGGCSLLSFGVAPTPTGAISGGEISDIAGISSSVRALMGEIKSRRNAASTGMWGTAVIVKKITIPKMEANLVADQIRWEAEQYIPFDINEISLAYHILKRQGNNDTMDVLLIAAQNELVMQYAEAVEGAGLSCSTIDVAGFALANCFELNYGSYNECVALLNIGAGSTNFVVLNAGEVIFSRDIPTGGQTYTNDIHKEMGVTMGEAEALKLSASAGREVPDEVHAILLGTHETVTEEINNSFEFFAATSNGLSISRCFFCGGGAAIPGLIDQISRNCNLRFERLDPFLKIKAANKSFSSTYLEQIKPFAAVVTGLAMRKIGDK